VTCPGGSTINYRTRSNCGGQLDVDMGPRREPNPVENVYYGRSGGGTYRIRVNLYKSDIGGRDENFVLQIRDRGRVQVLEGSVGRRSANWTYDYTPGGN
jgi:hypothetical protein